MNKKKRIAIQKHRKTVPTKAKVRASRANAKPKVDAK